MFHLHNHSHIIYVLSSPCKLLFSFLTTFFLGYIISMPRFLLHIHPSIHVFISFSCPVNLIQLNELLISTYILPIVDFVGSECCSDGSEVHTRNRPIMSYRHFVSSSLFLSRLLICECEHLLHHSMMTSTYS